MSNYPVRISSELEEVDGLSFDNILLYDKPIDEAGRKMTILWDGQMPIQEVYKILSKCQDQWEHPVICPEAQFVSCEQWMLLGLKRAGLEFIKLYSDHIRH